VHSLKVGFYMPMVGGNVPLILFVASGDMGFPCFRRAGYVSEFQSSAK
jgi:hypothetical protein